MQSRGIYTLANDVVFDQLVALLNSIEVNISPDIPVCVIPYDHRLERVKQEISLRKNVTLFDNTIVLETWDDFANQVWESYSRAKDLKQLRPARYKSPLQRKWASFNGKFDQFVFFDADSLAMKSVDDVFEKLNEYDFILDDWEHQKPREVTPLDLSIIEQKTGLTEPEIRPRLHCDSFFASQKGVFSVEQLEDLKKRAIDQGEIEWLQPKFWWSSAALSIYITFARNLKLFNFTRSPNGQEVTGNCADADAFVNINNILYNQDGLKPIHRIHYMNYSSADFARLCQGEDVNIRYQDIFLHYRFLKQPELKPQVLKPPSLLQKTNRKIQKAMQKLQKMYQ
ncbi:Npun_R2821/Npun_R2822 family protein [Planktothrix mougeotii]|uniref:Methionine synthase n=1 Tax=Planktothrix mougeotii LEGE 06226 TaxID=1828728 RepID=A0ABR9UCG1_9CYAN|nr:Npun_R2821/Npun_R2822 family protein [Planktothrix mougeotii]MBE9144167.1 methionine synthase [Planktothrix mougeotii LEGE 06226]